VVVDALAGAGQGLEVAYVELLSAHARPTAFHTVLLLIQSRTDDLPAAVIQANIMKNAGIKIVPIAVGPDVPLDELRKMATNPVDVELIPYDQIGSINLVLQLIPKLCPSPSEHCTTINKLINMVYFESCNA